MSGNAGMVAVLRRLAELPAVTLLTGADPDAWVNAVAASGPVTPARSPERVSDGRRIMRTADPGRARACLSAWSSRVEGDIESREAAQSRVGPVGRRGGQPGIRGA
jgi:hypothetical protein